MIGLLWVPAKHSPAFLECLGDKLTVHAKELHPGHLTPPTFFELNGFTAPFHEIVTTYGTPAYKEINPTPFNIVTFPFLFGVMFGDLGHGLLLFAFASYLCVAAGPSMLHRARYLLLMMGFFAAYCGLIYNDMMSLPLDLFGTCYVNQPPGPGGQEYKAVQKPDCVYPLGIDPKWYVSHNEVTYFNSLKMKVAVILGVL